jgi:thiamine-phosphate pyrophosphorylase
VTAVPPLSLKDARRVVYVVGPNGAQDADRLDAAMDGGVTCLWLRLPGATGAEVYRAAKEVLPRARRRHVALVLGDRADVALSVGAEGVHLGHRSPPARKVRPWFPGWLGVSCHSPGDLRRAVEAGADYAVLSPLFGVPEKGPPLGVAKFEAMRATVGIPVVALGGIETANAAEARLAGADGVAVVRALRDAPDPRAAARALSTAMTPR